MIVQNGSSNTKKKHARIGGVIAAGILIPCAVFLYGMIAGMMDSPSDNASRDGEQISNSIYTRYNGDIYARVPSDGLIRMPEADAGSFRVLSEENSYKEPQFGIDNYHSYCGNAVVADLDPQRVKSLGNDYFTDGKKTLYCARMTQDIPGYSSWNTISDTWLYGWRLAGKPQRYYYPAEALPYSDTPYKAFGNYRLATNDRQVFYAGKLMPDASADSLRPVKVRQDDGSWRDSALFYQDDKHAWYQHEKLPVNTVSRIYSFYIGTLFQQNYLYEPDTGQVFINNRPFPAESGPYRVISHYGQHVNHGLFLSPHGVYFYDSVKQQISRAGDNPFLNPDCRELSPLIFACGRETYYLKAESRHGGRRSPGLISRSTLILRAENIPDGEWKKTGDTPRHRFGEIWQRGNEFYYFDRLGDTQLIFSPVYRIADNTTRDRLLNDPAHRDNITRMIKAGQLQDISGTEVLRATTKYK